MVSTANLAAARAELLTFSVRVHVGVALSRREHLVELGRSADERLATNSGLTLGAAGAPKALILFTSCLGT